MLNHAVQIFFYPLTSAFLLAIFFGRASKQKKVIVWHFFGLVAAGLGDWYYDGSFPTDYLQRLASIAVPAYLAAVVVGLLSARIAYGRKATRGIYAGSMFVTWTPLSMLALVFTS